jgi:hypothetical protein
VKLIRSATVSIAVAVIAAGATAPAAHALTNPADNPYKITVEGDDGNTYVDGQDTLPGYDDEACTYIPGAWFDFAKNRVRYADGQSIPWTEWERATGYDEWLANNNGSSGGSSPSTPSTPKPTKPSSSSGAGSSSSGGKGGSTSSNGSTLSSGSKASASSSNGSSSSESSNGRSAASGAGDNSSSVGVAGASSRDAAAIATPGATAPGTTAPATPGAVADTANAGAASVGASTERDDVELVASTYGGPGSTSGAGLLILAALAALGGLAVGGRSLSSRFAGKGSAS